MRNIAVDGNNWRYKVGKDFLVARLPNTKQKLLIHLYKLLGYTHPHYYEIDRWNRSHSTRVNPKLVADFIRHSNWYLTATVPEIIQHKKLS